MKRVASPVSEPFLSSVSPMDPFDFEPANGSAVRKDNIYGSNFGSEDGFVKPAKEPPPKRNKFFKSKNLFDSLKNGPTYNSDKIDYSAGYIDDACLKDATEHPSVCTLVSSDAASDPEYGSIISKCEDSNELTLKSRSTKTPSVILDDSTEKTDFVRDKSSEQINFCNSDSSNSNNSTNISSCTGNADSQENVEDSSSNLKVSQSESTSSQSCSGRPAKKFFTNRHSRSSNSPSKVSQVLSDLPFSTSYI